jgi:hypothetical protein
VYYARNTVQEVEVIWPAATIEKIAAREITVAQAEQAINDPDAITYDPDPNSQSGQSIRIVGYSTGK